MPPPSLLMPLLLASGSLSPCGPVDLKTVDLKTVDLKIVDLTPADLPATNLPATNLQASPVTDAGASTPQLSSPENLPPDAEGIENEARANGEEAPADAAALSDETVIPPAHADAEVIVVTAQPRSPADPVQAINEVSYAAVQAVDDAIVAPITHGFMNIAPQPVQKGLHNVINNLDEPIVALNFLLQLKIGKMFETVGRFAVNSTVGVAGLFDVAKKKPFNLPRRSNGLADTLGFYGVGTGPYFFLPLIGPTTLRDGLARPFDLLVLPILKPNPFGKPTVAITKAVLTSLDDRRENDDRIKRVREESANPYITTREEYLARRKAEIEVLKGLRTSVDDPTPPVKKRKKHQDQTPATDAKESAPELDTKTEPDTKTAPDAQDANGANTNGAPDTPVANDEPHR